MFIFGKSTRKDCTGGLEVVRNRAIETLLDGVDNSSLSRPPVNHDAPRTYFSLLGNLRYPELDHEARERILREHEELTSVVDHLKNLTEEWAVDEDQIFRAAVAHSLGLGDELPLDPKRDEHALTLGRWKEGLAIGIVPISEIAQIGACAVSKGGINSYHLAMLDARLATTPMEAEEPQLIDVAA